MAVQQLEAPERPADPLLARLNSVLNEFAEAATDGTPVNSAVRIDRITALERLRAATAGLQIAESVRFAQAQVAEQLAAEVHPQKIGQGLAEQIALACGVSPVAGARRLGVARALWFDLRATYTALLAGKLGEPVAAVIVSETRHLDPATRARVDAALDAAGITGMGYREAAACARKHAYEADPQGYLDRGRTERKNRRVGIRPVPDTMAMVSAYVPVEQGVACYAALRKQADRRVAVGDERTRDQIMADTFVERLTGQSRAQDLDVEVHITIPLEALVADESDEPMAPVSAPPSACSGRPTSRTAQLAGHGPLPLALAREAIATSQGRKWWRRLFTSPSGHLVGGDPTRRRFDGWLAKLIELRDQTCRDPYCDAPIRHLDHIDRWSDGGPTSLANGRGTCARGNLIRELPGWQVTLVHAGHRTGAHTIQVTTPTGHRYHSRAPDPP